MKLPHTSKSRDIRGFKHYFSRRKKKVESYHANKDWNPTIRQIYN